MYDKIYFNNYKVVLLRIYGDIIKVKNL